MTSGLGSPTSSVAVPSCQHFVPSRLRLYRLCSMYRLSLVKISQQPLGT